MTLNQILASEIEVQTDTVIPLIINSRFWVSRGGMMDLQSLDLLSNVLVMGLQITITHCEQSW